MTTHTEQISGSAKEIIEQMREREQRGWEVMILAPLGTFIRNELRPGWHSPSSSEVETQSFLVVWDMLEDLSQDLPHPLFTDEELQAFLGIAKIYYSMPSAGSPDALRTALSKILGTGLDYPAEDWDQV